MVASASRPGIGLLSTVPATQLQPSRLPRHVIAREALLARLMQARSRRCVLVQGPAGSGKTTLLTAWRHALAAQDVDVAWLSLVPGDDDPHRFWCCVLASLARVDAELVRPAIQLLDRDDDDDADELGVVTLVQTLAASPRTRVLMLDDVQHLTHPRIGRMLHWLLDYAPAGFHLVLATRHGVPLPLERWRAQGELAEFDLQDLRFSRDEALRFLRSQVAGISSAEVDRLHQATDGWVAGLQLAAVPLRSRPADGAALPGPLQDPAAFAGYFEREVLRRLPAEDLDLMTHGAISHRFCASLCAALTGQAADVALERRLDGLQRPDLFVSRVSDDADEPWYRIHPLLREVLLARLAARSPDRLQELHRRAWRWFHARGAIDEAVRHAVLAQEADAGADLIERHAEQVMAHHGIAHLGVLVRLLPAETVRQRFRLRLLRAHIALAVRNLDGVEAEVAAMEQALAPSTADDDPRRQSLTVLRAGLALQRDDSDAILALRERLEAIPGDAPASDRDRRGQALAWLHMTRGDPAAAAQALDASESARSTAESRLIGDAFRGMSLAFEGRLAEAETLLRAVLDRAERQPDLDGSVVCLASGMLCDPLYEGNALLAVRSLVEPRLDLMERTVIPDVLLRAMTVLSSTHWILGNRLEALAVAQRLEDHALRHRLDRALAQALMLQLRWQLREGRTDMAQALLGRIEALGERHADARPGSLQHVLRVVSRARAAIHMHWNDFAQARAQLEPALVAAEASRRWRDAAATRMQLVLANARDGREAQARSHLDAALQLGHRMGLQRSLLDAGSAVPAQLRAWQQAQGEGADPVLAFYVRRLLGAAEEAHRLAQPQPGSGGLGGSGAGTVSLSVREREVLALVARALPNKKIARALDVTPHTVKFHLRNIYLKLGVSERDQALARWQSLQDGRKDPQDQRENSARW